MYRLAKHIGLLLFTVVSFTACFGGQEHKDDPEMMVYEGVLTEQSSSDTEPGTHFLELESGEIVAVNSLELNLSDIAYLDNRVQATGVMDEDSGIFRVSGISVTELLSDERAEVVSFKEYENEEFGFKIKHNSDWIVSVEGNSVIFEAPAEDDADPSFVRISQSPFQYEPVVDEETGEQDSALEAYIEQNYPNLLADIDSYMSKIGPEQMNAVKLEEKAGSVYFYVYRFGLIYEISLEVGDADEDELVFYEMISEFSFMPFDEHSDSEDKDSEEEEIDSDSEEALTEAPELDIKMSSFESLPFSFRGSYPASWYYAGSKSTEVNVLHHYGFADEVVEGNNEIISLDVMSISEKGGNGVITETHVVSGDKYYFAYVTVEGQHYRFHGPEDYSEIITAMAYSIEHLDEE